MGCAAGQIQRAEQLRVGVFELGQAVVALVACHGGEYAAVVFKIELAAPAGHVLSGKAAFQLFKERQRSALACAGRAHGILRFVQQRRCLLYTSSALLPHAADTVAGRKRQALEFLAHFGEQNTNRAVALLDVYKRQRPRSTRRCCA